MRNLMILPWRAACALVAICVVSAALAQPPPLPAASAETPPGASRSDYVIGPGDMLQVFVWRNPDLSANVPVRPDGRISTPLVEDMLAVGKTPAQLARDIEGVLSEFVRGPKVNIILQTAVGTLSQVKVLGEVKSPQSVAYRDGLHVLDVVLQSGGLTEFAAPNRAKVIRTPPGGGKMQEIPVRLGDLLQKGDVKQNVALQPGDMLVIPQARF